MRIGIPGYFADVLPLLINLALYLQDRGEEVFFIDPQPREVWVLKKHGLNRLFSKDICIQDEAFTPEAEQLLYEIMHDIVERGPQRKTLKRNYLRKRALFVRENIEFLVVWNGALSMEHEIARELSIDKIYLENGYFPDTLQVDRIGVNCQTAFSAMSYEAFLAHTQMPPTDECPPAEIRHVKLNSAQCLLNFGLILREPMTLLQKLLFYQKKIISQIKASRLHEKNQTLPEPYIFIPFQVHDDSQLRCNSPIVKSMNDVLDMFYEDMRQVFPNHRIVIKEHPYDLGRHDYSELKRRYPDILWLKKHNVNELLEKAEVVITVNSSVGLQAIAQHKKVLVLGDCFYRNNPFSEAIQTSDEFKNKLEALRDKSLDTSAVDQYIEHFKKNIFISGGRKTFTPKTLAQIYAFIKA